jgi:hypothetical protein
MVARNAIALVRVFDRITGTWGLRNCAIGQVADGKPDFIYDPSTGDVVFRLDGFEPKTWLGVPSFVADLSVASSAGILRLDRAQGGAVMSLTPTLVGAAQSSPPGLPDGYDFGCILPAGLSENQLMDLEPRYGVLNAGTPKLADFMLNSQANTLQLPEPASTAFVLLLGALTLFHGRRLQASLK